MLIIRADANEFISAGHIMRCLAIAQEWHRRGGDCLFVSSDAGAARFVESKGFRCIALNSNWKDLNGEISAMQRIVRGHGRPALLVDTYSITARYIEALSPFAAVGYMGTKRIISNRLAFLINYSVNIDEVLYDRLAEGGNCRMLLGPRYAPLRKGFQDHRPRSTEKVRNILLTTGNGDAIGITTPIIEALMPLLDANGARIKVVIGSLFSNKDELYNRFAHAIGVELLADVDDMAPLMLGSDVAVSACGTTLYELAACGVPTVGFSLVPEQDSNGETDCLMSKGVIEYAGRAYEDKDACISSLRAAVASLVNDAARRDSLARAFHELIDGNGVVRICNVLEELGVS